MKEPLGKVVADILIDSFKLTFRDIQKWAQEEQLREAAKKQTEVGAGPNSLAPVREETLAG